MFKLFLKYKYYLFSLIILLIIILGIWFLCFKKVNIEDSVFEDITFIGHGLYGIDGKDYSNSLESLELGYNNGIRVMEADFLFTSDGSIVLNHYWEFSFIESYREFLDKKILDKYTSMDIYDLLKCMEKYNDLYIIIDTKEDEYCNKTALDIIEKIVEITKEYDEKLLDRFIVQIYNSENYKEIMNIYNFKNKLVTVYKMNPLNVFYITYYCLINNIDTIVIPLWYIDDGIINEKYIRFIKSKNIKIFVHTVNDRDIYNNLLDMGIDGVYTDSLS